MPNRAPTYKPRKASGITQHEPPSDVDLHLRGTAASRGYGPRWKKARKHWLRIHPLCTQCLREGVTCAATVVDHIIPHRGDRALFWDSSNWQSLCLACHNRKTGSGK